MNYVERFIAEFNPEKNTETFEVKPGIYHAEKPSMEISARAVRVTKFWYDECFLSNITFEPEKCHAVCHLHLGPGHPMNKSEQREYSYEYLFDYVQSRMYLRFDLTKRLDVNLHPRAHEPENYLKQFLADFSIPDVNRVTVKRDFLTCEISFWGTIRVRADKIKIFGVGRERWTITATKCQSWRKYNYKKYPATYDEVIKFALIAASSVNTFSLLRAPECVFATIVMRELPQPIAEEIIPHLRRGLRSFAWYAVEE